MEDEVSYPSGFGPPESTADADLFTTLPRDAISAEDNDNSAARRLKSFVKRVLKKIDSRYSDYSDRNVNEQFCIGK
jgi:hypothetical protein